MSKAQEGTPVLPRWDGSVATRRPSRRAATLCLALIVVQNSSLILVTSYSRTLLPAYLPSVAVCLSELLKLCAAWWLLVLEVGSTRRALQQVSALLAEHSRVTMQFAVPALCYTIQNNLWYYSLSNLDPITAAVTSQMKVITTALASVLMLGRRLSAVQWSALFLLTLGMVCARRVELRPRSGLLPPHLLHMSERR